MAVLLDSFSKLAISSAGIWQDLHKTITGNLTCLHYIIHQDTAVWLVGDGAGVWSARFKMRLLNMARLPANGKV